VPPALRARLRPLKQRAVRSWTPALLPRWTALPRRTAPVSRAYGFDRGTPIDRYYVEDFLWRHGPAPDYATGDIRGHVIEVGGDEYATRFGGAVTRIDVLHVSRDNPMATVVGDLADGAGIPSDRYDCVICAQTLQVIFDVRGVVATLHRMLRSGGVALVTTAGIASACKPDRDQWGDYWRFTSRSLRMLFEEVFASAEVTVEAYGNVLSAAAFLYGVAAEELHPRELDCRDPDYEVLLTVRARKT
jgi:hypothetical protein